MGCVQAFVAALLDNDFLDSPFMKYIIHGNENNNKLWFRATFSCHSTLIFGILQYL